MAGESNTPTPPPTPTRAVARQATSRAAFVAEPPSSDDPLLSFTPVPHVAPRKNSITAERQRAFIAQLAATGIVKQAALHIGASIEALYKLRQKAGGEEFSAAWDAAIDRGIARLEDCALARAIAGEERLVVSAGKILGSEVRHNEALVMFFLKARRGERYAPEWRKVVPGHPVYENIRAEVTAEVTARVTAECEARQAERDRKRAQAEAARDAAIEERRRRFEEAEEAEEARLAAEAEAALTPEDRERDDLLNWLAHMSLDQLKRTVGW